MQICLFIILSKWFPDHWKSKKKLVGLIGKAVARGGGVPKVHVYPPLGLISGPQTPRPIILHPPFLNPGYGLALTYPRFIDTYRGIINGGNIMTSCTARRLYRWAKSVFKRSLVTYHVMWQKLPPPRCRLTHLYNTYLHAYTHVRRKHRIQKGTIYFLHWFVLTLTSFY